MDPIGRGSETVGRGVEGDDVAAGGGVKGTRAARAAVVLGGRDEPAYPHHMRRRQMRGARHGRLHPRDVLLMTGSYTSEVCPIITVHGSILIS